MEMAGADLRATGSREIGPSVIAITLSTFVKDEITMCHTMEFG